MKFSGTSAAFVMIACLCFGARCTPIDKTCADTDVTCSPEAMAVGVAARTRPAIAVASCAEVQTKIPGAADGEYTLTLPGGNVKVYCLNIATTPAEYLTFQNCNANGQPNANSSFYARGGANINASPGGLWTYYNRVRFNPATLTIDQTDRTFSTNNGGSKWFGANTFYDNDYGDGSACGCDGTMGSANIDLTGLPFILVQGQFVIGGAGSAGSINYSPDNKMVDLTGGGCCGFNNTNGNPIQLSW